jgi:hypothetical protein
MSSVYVFAIARDRAPAFEFEGHRIEFIPVAGIAAAIEQVDAPPSLSEASLRLQHEIVLRVAARVNEILPVRFGAVMDRQELDRVLTSRKGPLEDALDLVRSRVQMTIRVRHNEPVAPAAKVSLASGKVTGTAYLEGRRAATSQPLSPVAATIIAAVRQFVVAERHDSAPRSGTVATYHVIERRDVLRYRAALSHLDAAVGSVSGPWPPFAFAPDLWP